MYLFPIKTPYELFVDQDDMIESLFSLSSPAYKTVSPVQNILQSKGPLFAVINGTPGNDFIDGTEFDDIIDAGDGNDQVDALGGNDIVYGGTGNDILFGGDGDDMLYAGAQGSSGFSGSDTLNGGAGNDMLFYTYAGTGSGSFVTAIGGEGIDTFVVLNDPGPNRAVNLTTLEFTFAGFARGSLSGVENVTVAGDLIVTGDADNNVIEGTSTTEGNSFFGLAGDDLIFGGGGSDSLHGGDGYDTVGYTSSPNGVIVDLAAGTAVDGFGYVDSIFTFEAVLGSEQNDILYGDDNSNALGGSAGDDFLDGRGGDDILIGGLGSDTYAVDSALDVITEGAGEGLDAVYATVGYTLADNVEIGVSLTVATAASLTGNGLDNVLILNSIADGNTMAGAAGNDTLYAQNNTVMYGNEDNDVLVLLGSGNYAEGNAGDDVYINSGTNSTIVEYAGQGLDTVYSYSTMTLGENIEILALISSDPNAQIHGTGNSGANTLIGTGGANILVGLAGADFIIGGGGNDFIAGGEGIDVLQGNSGSDSFYYDSGLDVGDVIQDWVAADDSFVFAAAAFGFTAGQTLVNGNNFISGTDPLQRPMRPRSCGIAMIQSYIMTQTEMVQVRLYSSPIYRRLQT